MATTVIINLAEKAAGAGGTTGKVKSALEEGGGTVGANSFKKGKVELGRNSDVKKFDLLVPPRAFDRTKAGFWFGLGVDVLSEIRLACLDAEQVYLCAHGSAADRNQVFADIGGLGRTAVVATVAELSDFVEMILDPAHRSTYELVLVICYAARSANPDEIHTKNFLKDTGNLNSSLAYKLFKRLDAARIPVRMIARLGQVKVDMAKVSGKYGITLLTQTEAGVKAGLRMAEKGHEFDLLDKKLSGTLKDKWETVKDGLMRNLRRPEGKDQEEWLRLKKELEPLAKTQATNEADPSRGVLVYEKEGGMLRINFQGKDIYRGVML